MSSRSASTDLLFVAGTRPEALKLAPVIRELRENNSALRVRVCFSGQHQEILRSVLGDLDVRAEIELPAPAAGVSLSAGLAHLLEGLGRVIAEAPPAGVVVQGDTNTVLAGALAAFHHQLPVFHVEAGLRTADPMLPFPEEMNRRLVTRLAALHFAPTDAARQALLAEGVPADRVEVTGNTGIDALRLYSERRSPEADAVLAACQPASRKLLVTLHRRENKGAAHEATDAMCEVLRRHPDTEVLWLLHHNGIRQHVLATMRGVPRVHLIEPLPYPAFVQLMRAAHFILSDSGGVQEEAPSLGKPVLVLRDTTERPEAVEAGASRLVGCDARRITAACTQLLGEPETYARMSQRRMLYGDGFASRRIRESLERYFRS